MIGGSAVELSLRQLNRATLARQFLLEREKTTPVKAIERLVAMQAQLPRPPFVGLWTRLAAFDRAQLIKLLHKRSVVRGTLLRGTLHLLSAKDYRAFRPALQPMLDGSIAQVLRERAKDLPVAQLGRQAMSFLDDGPKTFEQIRAELVRLNPGRDDRAMGYAVRCALHLLQVPVADTTWGFPTDSAFTPAASWLEAEGTAAPDPGPLVLRYLAAFGPAGPADMQAWSGLKDLAPAFEKLRPKLKVFTGPKGKELFDLPKAPRPDGDVPAPVRFLPDFDNLVLGHHDRTRVIADAHRPHVATKNLQILPTFLVDGFVAGTWKLDRARASATLTLRPFDGLSKKVKDELQREGAGLVKFVEPDAAKQLVLFDYDDGR